jgi:hypothetical protein
LAQGRHRVTIVVVDIKANSIGISAIADRRGQLSGVAYLTRGNTAHEGYQRTITPNKNVKILSQMNHLMKMALGEPSGVEIQASAKVLVRNAPSTPSGRFTTRQRREMLTRCLFGSPNLAQQQATTLRQQLVGTWEVVSFSPAGLGAAQFVGTNPKGYVVLAGSGKYVAVLGACPSNRKSPDHGE